MFLGLPFNIACYALLASLLAMRHGLTKSDLTVSFGDVHIYENHLDAVREQLGRKPTLPPMLSMDARISKLKDMAEITADMVNIVGYNPHPALRGEVAV